MAQSALATSQNPIPISNAGKTLAYVGTYTSAVDGEANGEGIYLLEMNPANGELSNANSRSKDSKPVMDQHSSVAEVSLRNQ